MHTPDLIADMRRGNCEGPIWDERRGTLYFVAIPEGEIHALGLDGQIRSYALGRPCGAVLTTRSGRLIAALKDGLFFLDPETGATAKIADPEEDMPENRFNDCKCDPFGRLFAGTMAEGGKRGRGALYRMDADGAIVRVLSGVSISNGLDWSPDGTIMYYIDTATRQVEAFDYDGATGNMTNRRTVLAVPPEHGFPDGMTVDASGDLWVALWGGWGILHMTRNGEILEKIPMPAERVSSCCFGGPDMADLFITTARSPSEDPKQAHAGGVFRIRTGAKGKPAIPFDDTRL